MTPLQDAIAQLYKVFKSYTAEGMHYCDCGCIGKEEVQRLQVNSLKELSEEAIARYHGSALYTWGDVVHYKHYLPRILEVYTRKRKGAMVDLYDIGSKLEYANWLTWPQGEVQALKEFIMTDWMDFANNRLSEISKSDLENYNRFLSLQNLLQSWQINRSTAALKNFVYFFYSNGNSILNSKFKLGDKNVSADFRQFIHTDHLVLRLQEVLFNQNVEAEELATKASVVLQMIEQQSSEKDASEA